MFHHWDFFGTDSQKTAEHFKMHLDQFLAAGSIEAKLSGYFRADAAHACVWIEVESDEHATLISARLKPQRNMTAEEHRDLVARIDATASESM